MRTVVDKKVILFFIGNFAKMRYSISVIINNCFDIAIYIFFLCKIKTMYGHLNKQNMADILTKIRNY